MKTNQTIRSFRSQATRRCYQMFMRDADGKQVRLLSFTDYKPCALGGDPREFLKLLTHSRHPIGCHVPKSTANFYSEKIIPALQPGVWTEVVIK
ncbi:MAG: hypothetical protein FD135_3627 [Comamonadaceae bacterium]|nr:MAG: hypothetical protein FD135_3627 [Comamonadaceae bacterium]